MSIKRDQFPETFPIVIHHFLGDGEVVSVFGHIAESSYKAIVCCKKSDVGFSIVHFEISGGMVLNLSPRRLARPERTPVMYFVGRHLARFILQGMVKEIFTGVGNKPIDLRL